jgi:hypothetical protein
MSPQNGGPITWVILRFILKSLKKKIHFDAAFMGIK